MRREELYLRDIVEAAEASARFLTGVERDRFSTDEMVQSAVLHQLTVIGEAASRLPQDLRDRWPEIAWRQIIGLRNIVVHQYFSVRLPIVWDSATRDVPELSRIVDQILAAEFSTPDEGAP
jgi:uncharacterized protein with HEPN domain